MLARPINHCWNPDLAEINRGLPPAPMGPEFSLQAWWISRVNNISNYSLRLGKCIPCCHSFPAFTSSRGHLGCSVEGLPRLGLMDGAEEPLPANTSAHPELYHPSGATARLCQEWQSCGWGYCPFYIPLPGAGAKHKMFFFFSLFIYSGSE